MNVQAIFLCLLLITEKFGEISSSNLRGGGTSCWFLGRLFGTFYSFFARDMFGSKVETVNLLRYPIIELI